MIGTRMIGTRMPTPPAYLWRMEGLVDYEMAGSDGRSCFMSVRASGIGIACRKSSCYGEGNCSRFKNIAISDIGRYC